MKVTLPALALAAALAIPASAAESVIAIRPEQMTVTWTLGALLHAVHGRFATRGGSLRYDPESKSAGGEVTVDLASGESGNAKRDAKMHDDVLESAKYPLAMYSPRTLNGRLEPDGISHLELTGTLLIHGARHDLTLPLEVVTHAGRIESGETHFSIPYVAWGMRDPSVFLLRVSDHVDVDVRMTAGPSSAMSSRRRRVSEW